MKRIPSPFSSTSPEGRPQPQAGSDSPLLSTANPELKNLGDLPLGETHVPAHLAGLDLLRPWRRPRSRLPPSFKQVEHLLHFLPGQENSPNRPAGAKAADQGRGPWTQDTAAYYSGRFLDKSADRRNRSLFLRHSQHLPYITLTSLLRTLDTHL